MKTLRQMLAAFAAFASLASSAQAPPQRPPRPPIEQILAEIGVDKARASKAAAVLDSGHEKVRAAREQIGRPTDDTTRATMKAAMDAIRSDTDSQLAGILTADELGKLKAAMPPPAQRGPRSNG
jgi:hypothetical protein